MRKTNFPTLVIILCVLAATSITLVPAHHTIGDATGLRPENDVAEIRGTIAFDWPRRSQSTTARYEYTVNPNSRQGELRIMSVDPHARFRTFRLRPEVGQQFLRAAFPARFGGLGDLLCTEWEYGASSNRFMVFRLDERGSIETVFDKTCRFGCKVVNLGISDIPTICAGSGSLGGPKEMGVYTWTGSKFELLKTFSVDEAHAYALATRATEKGTVRVAK